MVQHGEIVMFLIGIGALAFAIANRAQVMRIPHARLFLLAFYFYLGGSGF